MHFIFDMGGVLKKAVSYEEIEKYEIGINYKDEAIVNYVHACESELMMGNITMEEFIQDTKRFYRNPNITVEQYEEDYMKIGKDIDILFPDTENILKSLKNEGHKVYLLSNLIEISYKELARLLDCSIFDKQFLSYEMHMLKPNDDIYQAVIKRIHAKSSNMIFFDDNPDNIAAAKRNGMQGYVVADGSKLKEYVEQAKKDNNL